MDTNDLPWIDVNYELEARDTLLDLIKQVPLVQADNKVLHSYDEKYSRAHNLVIGAVFEKERVFAEGYDMQPLPNQEIYKELLEETHKASMQAMKDLGLPQEIMFTVGIFIKGSKKTKYDFHTDGFRNCNISFPLSLEGSKVIWKKEDNYYEKIYNSTTVLDTYTPHAVDNFTDNDRWLYQLTFRPDLYIDDIRKYFQ